MPDAVIDNPILNSPFEEPSRHWKFERDGITNEVVEGRRVSSYFMPIPKSKRGGDQMQFETEWTSDRIEENQTINRIRERVSLWRRGGWPGVTPTTRRLLDYWTEPSRDRKLFFAQVEAVETAIYIGEVINKAAHQDAWITNFLREAAEDANPGLFRIALKMATGSGKTVVMAMLIAWQALNKAANKQDARFSDAFLLVSPGITIRDRLRVLLPESPDNYYRERDLIPPGEQDRLGQARIVITNFHTFLLRDRSGVSKVTKQVLAGRDGRQNPLQETPDQMARRVCRALGNKRGVIVINDEAHHCYRHRIGGDAEDFFPDATTAESKQEVKEREEEARVWISGLEAINAKYGVKTVYDLSATPFFLAGSGYPEGRLFPWVVSDFALIDAIEAGLVKVPRVPVSDNTGADTPMFRNLWTHVRKDLPKRNVRQQDLTDQRRLPAPLEAALHSLYSNYEQSFEQWQAMEAAAQAGTTPPVFIVVCNNTSVSKLVFDWIAGWERTIGDDGQTVAVKGALPLFSNVDDDGNWIPRPNTILVDSAQLESGEAMSADFKKAAGVEIERFKDEFCERFPGRDAEDLTDEDLMREVMNTVGKPGRLGEHVRCVVSVSMLTEGWDANTVTHILGVRAFGTQLLCEQVVGRGLRRRSYAVGEDGRFVPEYAEVYGVPFSFIPAGGSNGPAPPPPYRRVRALEERAHLENHLPARGGLPPRGGGPAAGRGVHGREPHRPLDQGRPVRDGRAPDRGREEPAHARRPARPARPGGRLRHRQARAGALLPRPAVAVPTARGHRARMAPGLGRAQGQHLHPDAAARAARRARQRAHQRGHRPRRRRPAAADRAPRALRPHRLHAARRLRHLQEGHADQRPPVPCVRRRRRQRMGAHRRRAHRGDVRGPFVREERPPRLRHPLRLRRDAARLPS